MPPLSLPLSRPKDSRGTSRLLQRAIHDIHGRQAKRGERRGRARDQVTNNKNNSKPEERHKAGEYNVYTQFTIIASVIIILLQE